MLQVNEIQQRFSQIQQSITAAEQVCRSQQGAPDEIRDVIQQLTRESQQAQSVMQSNDQQRMVECVDSLESVGDEAKRLTRTVQSLPAELEDALLRVHSELSQLKHQLH